MTNPDVGGRRVSIAKLFTERTTGDPTCPPNAAELRFADRAIALANAPLQALLEERTRERDQALSSAQSLPGCAASPATEAVWRVCEVIKGDCKRCPATEEMPPHGLCIRACYHQAEECVNTVETGNPWRKTGDVREPFISAMPLPSPPLADADTAERIDLTRDEEGLRAVHEAAKATCALLDDGMIVTWPDGCWLSGRDFATDLREALSAISDHGLGGQYSSVDESAAKRDHSLSAPDAEPSAAGEP